MIIRIIPAQSVNNISVGSQRRIKHTFTQHRHQTLWTYANNKREKREREGKGEAKGET